MSAALRESGAGLFDLLAPGPGLDRRGGELEPLRRELEVVLNARLSPDADLTDSDELRGALIGYGVPDVTALHGMSARERAALLKRITRAIQTFEPRLRGVQVEFVEAPDSLDQRLHFKIRATLYREGRRLGVIDFDTRYTPGVMTLKVTNARLDQRTGLR
ncbi:MAG: type VI secretion system baseplate subunit TssE [Planctomycetota bacterium]